MATARPVRLHFTENDEADELLAREPLALLIGFLLDQQVPVQKAFSSPLVLRSRLGELDVQAIAQMDLAELERVFRERPALHRFPGSMAARTHDLCATLVDDYNGDPERIWADVHDAAELEQRLLSLPGIGPMKARTLIAVLAKRFGIRPEGWEECVPGHPTLGDVESTEALLTYQAQKRAHKAARRAEAAVSRPS